VDKIPGENFKKEPWAYTESDKLIRYFPNKVISMSEEVTFLVKRRCSTGWTCRHALNLHVTSPGISGRD